MENHHLAVAKSPSNSQSYNPHNHNTFKYEEKKWHKVLPKKSNQKQQQNNTTITSKWPNIITTSRTTLVSATSININYNKRYFTDTNITKTYKKKRRTIPTTNPDFTAHKTPTITKVYFLWCSNLIVPRYNISNYLQG